MFYGTQVWDPCLIIAQILAVQCLFYLSLGFLEWIIIGGFVDKLTLRYFFDWHALSMKLFQGSITALVHIINALFGGLYLMFVVERAKKCLDFSATCYFIHFLVCSFYSGLPHNVEWWAANAVGAGLMALLGEWLCLKREMQEIPTGSIRVRSTTSLLGSQLRHITAVTH